MKYQNEYFACLRKTVSLGCYLSEMDTKLLNVLCALLFWHFHSSTSESVGWGKFRGKNPSYVISVITMGVHCSINKFHRCCLNPGYNFKIWKKTCIHF